MDYKGKNNKKVRRAEILDFVTKEIATHTGNNGRVDFKNPDVTVLV